MTAVIVGAGVAAWQVGVLAGLLEAGIDLRGASCVMGTSAGAVVAARLAAGIDPRADAARHARRRATRRAPVPGDVDAFIARIAPLIPAGWPPALRIVATDADSGERVVFDAGSGVPLARAVAAAHAVPGRLEPVRIGGRRFVDGAQMSPRRAA